MSRQILLCVETNSKARTDYQYINETIHRFYVNDPKISYKPIFLESKSMYASPKKQKEIGKYIKAYPEDTTVIYFIDLDDYDTNYETKKLFEDIKKYCETHAYELVFFCRDVEEVYLGKRVNDKDKVNEVCTHRLTLFIKKYTVSNVHPSPFSILMNGTKCQALILPLLYIVIKLQIRFTVIRMNQSKLHKSFRYIFLIFAKTDLLCYRPGAV